MVIWNPVGPLWSTATVAETAWLNANLSESREFRQIWPKAASSIFWIEASSSSRISRMSIGFGSGRLLLLLSQANAITLCMCWKPLSSNNSRNHFCNGIAARDVTLISLKCCLAGGHSMSQASDWDVLETQTNTRTQAIPGGSGGQAIAAMIRLSFSATRYGWQPIQSKGGRQSKWRWTNVSKWIIFASWLRSFFSTERTCILVCVTISQIYGTVECVRREI